VHPIATGYRALQGLKIFSYKIIGAPDNYRIQGIVGAENFQPLPMIIPAVQHDLIIIYFNISAFGKYCRYPVDLVGDNFNSVLKDRTVHSPRWRILARA
jgi:hypothetical protein